MAAHPRSAEASAASVIQRLKSWVEVKQKGKGTEMAQALLPHLTPTPSSAPCFGRRSVLQQVAVVPQRQQQRWLTVAMVRPTKAADFRSLSNEEIETEIYESRSEILVTRIKQQKKQAFKPELFSWNRRKIAQLKTILREREIEQGISSRESKRLEKRKKVAEGWGQF